MPKKMILSTFLLIVLFKQDLSAQACCSAGTPILSSLEVSATPAETWQFGISYQYNFLNDVISGIDEIEGIRQRISQSALFEVSYGLNQYFSITSLFSFIQQERGHNSSPDPDLITRGIGDAVFLVKYNLYPLDIFTQRQFSIGAGLKAPTGSSDLKLDGFLLPADMQPGTGSWDGIVWAYFFQGFLPSAASFITNASLRFTGTNNRFQLSDSNDQGYKFGNEFIMTTGMNYRTLSDFDLTIQARFRYLLKDQFAGSDVPNTGGNWLYLVPGINFNFDSFVVRTSGQIPVFRDLNGIQLTTSYTFSVSIFYTFSKNILTI